jgi:hypothetical protein
MLFVDSPPDCRNQYIGLRCENTSLCLESQLCMFVCPWPLELPGVAEAKGTAIKLYATKA